VIPLVHDEAGCELYAITEVARLTPTPTGDAVKGAL
jgi:hypothetical protein